MIEVMDPSSVGPTARPEGEEAMRHAGATGEDSRQALANEVPISDSPRGEVPDDGSLTSITRATSRIAVEPWRTGEPGHHEKRCSDACQACRLYAALYESQRACARAMNAMIRALWRADADALEVLGDEKITAKTWPLPRLNLYAIARRAAPDLATGIAASLSSAAWKKWRKVRFDALVRMTCSPPHYKRTLPIPVREQSMRFRHVAGDTYEVTFSLHPGRHPGGHEFRLPIEARDGWMREKLRALTSGEWRLGEAKIEQDPRRPAKWHIRFAYTRKVVRSTGAKTAGINRGMVCFLAMITSDGARWTYYGEEIQAVLRQIQRRRRAYQNQSKASNRGGHGRDRTLLPLIKLQDLGTRWRATQNQTIARRAALWLHKQGVGKVYLEDFAGIRDGDVEALRAATPRGQREIWKLMQEWPYYDLGQRFTACLDEVGIAHEAVAAKCITRTCSRCGWVASSDVMTAAVDLARRRFTCSACGLVKHLDVNAGENVRQRGVLAGSPETVKKSNGSNGSSGKG